MKSQPKSGTNRLDGKHVFVAHPFNARGIHIVQAIIQPALKTYGFECVICAANSSADVVNLVNEKISKCAGLIAAPIDRNPNVFFELGLAVASGKPCILISEFESDFAMLAGKYPEIIVRSDAFAVSELVSHLEVWERQFALEGDAATDI